MSALDGAHVKNIVLLGHAGSGKTTLAESMLYEAGMINRRGSVEERNTVSDYTELEKERGNSLCAKLLLSQWRGFKINILDTPGNDDFSSEVIGALKVADTAVVVLNAASGVEVYTEILWEHIRAFKTPSVILINQLDHPKADFEKSFQDAKAHFGNQIALVQYPVGSGAGFEAVIDVLNLVMYRYDDGAGKPGKYPVPAYEKEKAERLHKELVEAIASSDENLMELYFEKGELTEEEMKKGLLLAMVQHQLFPVFCASGLQNRGVARLLSYVDNVCPAAAEMPSVITPEGVELNFDPEAPVCIFVFKTVNEPHTGELSFFKVYVGTLRPGTELVNAQTGSLEKLNQLFIVEGSRRKSVDELHAGDIGAVLKLKNTHTNNSLHEKNHPVTIEPIRFPEPKFSIAIVNNRKGEEEKLALAIQHLKEEDPSLQLEVNSELGQTILHCQGDMHFSVIRWKLENNYRLNLSFEKPKVPYRETICKEANAAYRHKKQSGGAGQFGEVSLRVEPYYENMPEPAGLTVRGKEEIDLPWGGKLVYYNCIVGGVIDARFLPSILKGIMEKMQQGPVTGSYVQNVRVCIFDGKMHSVDSNDMAFKTAGAMAFKEAFQAADPQLLEPVNLVEVFCPDVLTGSVMGDLQSRRAIVEGFGTEGGFTVIKSQVPQSELHDYASSLRSLTQGRARYKSKFSHYTPVSSELQKKLSEARRKVEKELTEV